jgi:uncharacterized protein YraI
LEQAFIDILKQLVKDQSSAALMDAKKCKALLADYTRNEYRKQSRLLMLTVEEGVSKAVEGAEDLAACKKAKIRELEEDYGISSAFTADVVNALALVLRGDTTVTISPTTAVPAPPPVRQKANSTAPPSVQQKSAPAAPPPQQKAVPAPSPRQEPVKYAVARGNVRAKKELTKRILLITSVITFIAITCLFIVPKAVKAARPAPLEITADAEAVIKTTETAEMTGNANFRKGPSTNDAVIRQLKKGDFVILTGEVSGGWTQILRDGEVGWVSSKFLNKREEKNATPQASAPQAATQTKPQPQPQKQNAEPQTEKQEEAQQAPVPAEEIVDWARGNYPASIVVKANSITGHNINITGARTVVQKPLAGHPNLEWAYVYVGDKKYGVVWDRTTYSCSMHDGIELGIGSEVRSAFDFYGGSDKDSIFSDISLEAPAIKVVK